MLNLQAMPSVGAVDEIYCIKIGLQKLRCHRQIQDSLASQTLCPKSDGKRVWYNSIASSGPDSGGVQGFSSWLSKNRDENPRMRALLVGILN